jgi:hypothetical protein
MQKETSNLKAKTFTEAYHRYCGMIMLQLTKEMLLHTSLCASSCKIISSFLKLDQMDYAKLVLPCKIDYGSQYNIYIQKVNFYDQILLSWKHNQHYRTALSPISFEELDLLTSDKPSLRRLSDVPNYERDVEHLSCVIRQKMLTLDNLTLD